MRTLLPVIQSILDEVREGLRVEPAANDMPSHYRRHDLLIIDEHDCVLEGGLVLFDCASGQAVMRVTRVSADMIRLTGEDPSGAAILAPRAKVMPMARGRVVAAVVRFPGRTVVC